MIPALLLSIAVLAAVYYLHRISHAEYTLKLIDELRAGDGHSVEITCDNPDPDTIEESCQVICVGDWTNWVCRSYCGTTLVEALERAHFQMQMSKPVEPPAVPPAEIW